MYHSVAINTLKLSNELFEFKFINRQKNSNCIDVIYSHDTQGFLCVPTYLVFR